MTEIEQQQQQQPTPPVGEDRRSFMRKVFLTSGAAAVATMAGGAATTAWAADPSASASPSPSGSPTRGPGAGVGSQTITEDFFGLTTNGKRIDDLFTVHSQGADTAPVIAAAKAFLAAMTDAERTKTQFTIFSTEWRLWSNLDPGGFPRQGVSLADLNDAQNALGTALLKAALSADGLQTTERIRQINLAAGKLVGNSAVFNDELYYWTLMGTPSATEPWGFQFDGHHLVINYFVLGNQVVMSPCFWGSEPTTMQIDGATVTACTEEVKASLAFIQTLSAAQQKTAIISATKADEDMKAGAFADNAVEAYAGIRATALSAAQRRSCWTSSRCSCSAAGPTLPGLAWPRSAPTSPTRTRRGSAAPVTPTRSTYACRARSSGSRWTARRPARWAARTARPAPTGPPSCTCTRSCVRRTATTTAGSFCASTT
jgi:uncharacterized protein DUF3500